MAIADVHCLPQHAIAKAGVHITPLIIAKLTRYSEKNRIMRSLKNLKRSLQQRKKKEIRQQCQIC